MELTGTGDDHLTSLSHVSLDTWVGLGETLETLDELWQIGGVLALDGDLDNGGDGELHDSHVVGGLGGGQSTRLEQVLIDTDQTDDVTGRDILDWLDVSPHHEDGPLDGLDEHVLLLTRNEVRTLDPDLWSGLGGTREDTTEGVESTLVGGWYHLGDVQHEGTLGVAVTDGDGGLIVHWTLVQGLDTVSLSGGWGRQVEHNHFQ